MKDTVEIRAYVPDDKNRLLAIWLAASRKGHPFFTDEQFAEHLQIVGDTYLPEAENWVAILDGEPVGFIGLIDTFIGGLFVDPVRHGLGIGRLLVDHAARLKGELVLEVYTLNENATAFYRHLGFEEEGRRPTDDSGLPFEVIRLRRG